MSEDSDGDFYHDPGPLQWNGHSLDSAAVVARLGRLTAERRANVTEYDLFFRFF